MQDKSAIRAKSVSARVWGVQRSIRVEGSGPHHRDEFVLGKKRFIVVAAGCMCVRKILFVYCCFYFLVFFLVRLRESPSKLRRARV